MQKYFFNKKTSVLIICLIFGALASPIIAYSLELLGDIIKNNTYNLIHKKILLCIIIIVSSVVLAGICNIYKSKFEIDEGNQLRKDIFLNLLNTSIKDFSQKDSAEYYNLILRKIDIWKEMYLRNILIIIQNSLEVLFVLIFLLKISYIAFIGVFISLVPLTINNIVFPKKIDKTYDKYLIEDNKMISKLKEFLSGFQFIKFNNAENIFSKKMNIYFNRTNKGLQKIWILNNMSGIMAYLGQLISQIAGILIGAYLLVNKSISFGEFLVIFQLSNSINEPIIAIINGTVGIQSVIHVVKELNNYISMKTYPYNDNLINSNIHKIEFKNFSFKYPNTDDYLLKNINFSFEANKKYLLIGKSGSGKSTLIKLIMKELDSYEGDILINDKNIKEISYNELFTKISYTSQKTYVFDMSVKDNIDLLSIHTNKEISNVIHFTCLDEFIQFHKDGVNTIVNEEVNVISGGEKSKIGLARAIISNKGVLIVDEALSPIDINTSNIIEKNLLNLENKILIHVAHKSNKNLYQFYDSIIEIKDSNLIIKSINKKL